MSRVEIDGIPFEFVPPGTIDRLARESIVLDEGRTFTKRRTHPGPAHFDPNAYYRNSRPLEAFVQAYVFIARQNDCDECRKLTRGGIFGVAEPGRMIPLARHLREAHGVVEAA